jgi:hypothetical protein
MSWSRATITQEVCAPPATAPDDAALVAAARVDPTAFAPLYARYLPPVYRYCYRRLGTSAAAEDATSEVFVKALAALPRFRAGSFRSWLFTSRTTSLRMCSVSDGYRSHWKPPTSQWTLR